MMLNGSISRSARRTTEVAADPLLPDPEPRNGDEHAQRERRGGRERAGRWLEPGMTVLRLAGADEQEERAQESQILLRMVEPDFPDLLLDGSDHDLQDVLPVGTLGPRGELSRDES